MSRHFNTPHTRNRSGYARQKKGLRCDRYGRFDNGKQISPDHIAGRSVWYPIKKEEEKTSG